MDDLNCVLITGTVSDIEQGSGDFLYAFKVEVSSHLETTQETLRSVFPVIVTNSMAASTCRRLLNTGSRVRIVGKLSLLLGRPVIECEVLEVSKPKKNRNNTR